jgi:hypothetical protein
MLYKKCRICGQIKELVDFHKKKDAPAGVRNECKECVKELQKKYKNAPDFKEKRKKYDNNRYLEQKEEILNHKKEYYLNNRNDILEQKREYRDKPENRERQREYNKYYKKEFREKFYKYRRENPHIIAWRSVLYSTLDRLDTIKQGHTIDVLGYSALDLKEHIEKQFVSGMTWKNYGTWHIDHIQPVISFDPRTDVKIVCALSNLRPMWATTREIDGIVYEGNLNRPKYD